MTEVNICNNCKGVGEAYYREENEIRPAQFKDTCKTCKGTGRLLKIYSEIVIPFDEKIENNINKVNIHIEYINESGKTIEERIWNLLQLKQAKNKQ